MIKIGRMVLGMAQTNTYFVYTEGDTRALVIDPADYGDKIYAALVKNGFSVEGILLTHGHFDHIWGVEALKEAANEGRENPIEVYANEAEKELLNNARMNVSAGAGRPCTIDADHYLKDGDVITLAGITVKMIATPGHTAGGCCYYFEDGGVLVSGDTLFAESVGRTDLPTGSMGTLVRSIKEKLYILPDDTLVYPGHGDSTTIGYEKQYNGYTG